MPIHKIVGNCPHCHQLIEEIPDDWMLFLDWLNILKQQVSILSISLQQVEKSLEEMKWEKKQ